MYPPLYIREILWRADAWDTVCTLYGGVGKHGFDEFVSCAEADLAAIYLLTN